MAALKVRSKNNFAKFLPFGIAHVLLQFMDLFTVFCFVPVNMKHDFKICLGADSRCPF